MKRLQPIATLVAAMLFAVSLPLSAAGPKIADFGAARDYCDTTALAAVEGIWEYPDDSTRVLVKRSPAGHFDFDIILISSPDCRLQPGDVIGSLRQLPDPRQYEMKLFREKKKEVFQNPGTCAATLDENKGALFVERQKFKISLGTLWFLPRFWRALRVKTKDPAAKLRHGLVRVYPEPVGRERRYL